MHSAFGPAACSTRALLHVAALLLLPCSLLLAFDVLRWGIHEDLSHEDGVQQQACAMGAAKVQASHHTVGALARFSTVLTWGAWIRQLLLGYSAAWLVAQIGDVEGTQRGCRTVTRHCV